MKLIYACGRVGDSYVIVMQVHDLLHFFPLSDHQLSFIWGSAKSGFMHLYHVTVSLEMSTSETRCPDDTGFNDMSLHPRESFFVSAVCLQILQVRVLIIELI